MAGARLCRHRFSSLDNAINDHPITLSDRPLESLLKAIASGDALARGCVNIINFDAVRRSVGERWPLRREQVWDHVRKTLEGRLSPSDTVERVGDVEFLIFMAVEGGAVAQTICLRALQDILVHYLGAFELADLTVKTVTAVHGSALSCVEVDPAAVMRRAAAEAAAAPSPLDDARPKSAASALAYVAHVRGHLLQFEVEDVTSLRHDALAGGRVRRIVMPDSGAALSRQAIARLDTATLSAIDMRTLDFATALLDGETGFAYPTLSLPVSLQTLGHSTARAAFIQVLRRLPPEQQRRLTVELVNLDEGTPASRIAEAVGSLRGLCRGVSAQADPTRRAMSALKNNNLMCIVISTAHLARPGVNLEDSIKRFADAARGVAPITTLRGRLLPCEFAAARDAGITYAIHPGDRRRIAARAA